MRLRLSPVLPKQNGGSDATASARRTMRSGRRLLPHRSGGERMNASIKPSAGRDTPADPEHGHKDTVLDRLGTVANGAQFVSFAPDLRQRHSRIHGYERNHCFHGPDDAAAALLAA